MKKFITFGEIMMRLSPPGMLRFNQAQAFDVLYGGGESNVAVSLANFGLPVEFVSCLPENALGDACLQFLRQYNVGVNYMQRGGARLGIYFLEHGSNMRGSQVIYDRANSAFATLQPGTVDWKTVFADAGWFHWTGITPAISQNTAAVCLEAVKTAHDMGITVSCDMNYRAKLWKWGKNASEVMRELVSYCDVAIGNEEDAEKVFGIKAPDTDVTSGQLDTQNYAYVCEELAKNFSNLKNIAITLRGSISASFNTWSAILWNQGNLFCAPTYQITDIVDRVGGGDSFMGGLIYGLSVFAHDYQKTINFAVAASALKHTIFGDFNLVSVNEVEKLIKGDGSGRISR
ncbi:MAG: sugar kinase [Anaerolineae bacterium]|nr:sugar kinase [Anaerolineae bacterium]